MTGLSVRGIGGGGGKGAAGGHAYKDKSKPGDIRSSNINAAKGNDIIFLTFS